MSFADHITRVPHVFDKARAEDVRIDGMTGPLADLLDGAAGSSPFLAGLIGKEATWLRSALQANPDEAFSMLMAETAEGDDKTLARDLRVAKGRVALLAGLADLGGVWALGEVTGALTRFADLATDRALRAAIRTEVQRGKLPGQGEDDIATAGGLSVLAMGKMGAFELNYSSDIDLICLYDETRFDPDDYAAARSAFVRAVRKMCLTLSERTADGYVFRTDLRLRPDAAVTPVAISMEAAERYYESFGRTWERAAFVKARPCAGDQAAGARFLDALRPFVWRRHLDFAAIQDAQDMRLRIREHKGLHKPISHLGHDLKLGQGGIREIEFFTQTRQIISGGRDPDLRVPGTVPGLTALAAKGWITQDYAETLIADYRALREVEHRVQMIADQQTHKLPETEEAFAQLAALAGHTPEEYARAITDRLHRVKDLTEGLYEQGGEPAPDAGIPEAFRETVERWTGYPSLRSPRAVEIFRRVRPGLLKRLEASKRPEEALAHFDGFLRGLPAGVQMFSLFEANPQLLDLVVDVVDTAPALGAYLARNAGVFDAVIGGAFFADWPGKIALRQGLTSALTEADDYERALDRARVWVREWHFRTGVHFLRGLIDAEAAGAQYADLAEAAVAALWPIVAEQFAAKHGAAPGRGAVVLAMGSLGAARLNAGSDLDLIVIYDGQGVDASDGRRPLATRAYYARLTQALVTAVSAPTAEGRLYEVDMRLRPSGRQGPVATSLKAFKSYQSDEAWTWEHLALTRAFPVAGVGVIGEDVEAFRKELLQRPRDRAQTLSDIADMRARLAAAKVPESTLAPKAGPGGLQDIELFAETGALLNGSLMRDIAAQIAATESAFKLSPDEQTLLEHASGLFWKCQCAIRLLAAGGAADPGDFGAGAEAFFLRETGAESLEALAGEVKDLTFRVAALIDKNIGKGSLSS
ncbi:MAG: glutamine-synthetase adenylyltransferase [Silicimonas sp.]|nr:glutamine-synthetase adenylyltransferase [Silicimonas sp.]